MKALQTLASISIYSVVIFGAILLVRAILGKRISPALQYALWFVLIARLLLPVTIGGVHLITLPLPEPQPAAYGAAPAAAALLQTGAGPADAADGTTPSDLQHTADDAKPAKADRPPLGAAQIALAIWLLGASALLIWFFALYLSLLLRIRRSAVPPSPRLDALFCQAKAAMGVKAKLRLITIRGGGSPALLFPNVVLMPIDTLSSLDEAQLRLAFLHELTHFQRGDQFVNVLLAMLRAVYWFNPVVWMASNMMQNDMEIACDSRMTRRFTIAQRQGYAALLLALSSACAPRRFALGMAKSSARRITERRIRGVFRPAASRAGARLACTLVALLLLFGCFTTACQPAYEQADVSDADTMQASSGSDTPVPYAPPAETTATYLAGVEDAPFAPAEASARIVRQKETITGNVTLSFDTAVSVPETDGYAVQRLKARSFTHEETERMARALLPGADWSQGLQWAAVKGDPDDANRRIAPVTLPNGMRYTFFATNAASFSFDRTDAVVYRESYCVGDQEMEDEFGAIIREPIDLSREAAHAVAEQALAEMNVEGFSLYSADRACLFGMGEASEEDGAMPVLSRGWDFVYMRDVNGLTVAYHGGSSGGPADPLRYETAEMEWIWIYVDESGISRFYWVNPYALDETLHPNVAIHGAADAALWLTDRLTHRYSYAANEAVIDIEVTALSLGAALIADAAGYGLPDKTETCLAIPAWYAACTITHGDGWVEYATFPFSAADGGALVQQDF